MTVYKQVISIVLLELLILLTTSCYIFKDIKDQDSDSGVENTESENINDESLRQEEETDPDNTRDEQKSTDYDKLDSKVTDDPDSEGTGKLEPTDSDEPEPIDSDELEPADSDAGKDVTVCKDGELKCEDRCVLNNIYNCGDCGHDCTALPHVVGRVECTLGVCVLTKSSCDSGWAHCSKDPDKGCETNITEASNCGECGNDCSKTNRRLCTPKQDGLDSDNDYECAANCSSDAPTQCGDVCVNTDDNPLHCGKCDKRCESFPDSRPVCKDSKCGFECIVSNYLKCSDGCFPNDDRHCGTCENDCSDLNQICDGDGHCVGCKDSINCTGVPPTCKVYYCSELTHSCELQNVAIVTECQTFSGYSGTCISGNCVVSGKHIGAGDNFACALTRFGKPVCWGDGLGRHGGIPSVSFASLSVGTKHACGVRVDGYVQCWGDNSFGQSSPPSSGEFTRVAAGNDHTCALKNDGEIICWGGNESGQSLPPQRAFSDLSAGYSFTCGILVDKTVTCWGWSDGRQDAPIGVAFDSISLGSGHTCGVRSLDSWVQCWGGGTPGPNIMPPSGIFSQVGLGDAHSCGIRQDGLVECWGGSPAVEVSPPKKAFSEIAGGDTFTCGITTAGTIECWGGGSTSSVLKIPDRSDF